MRSAMAHNDELVDWLLEASTPSIRYRTITDLLGARPESSRVRSARRAMLTAGPVPAILKRQSRNGSWKGERGYYTPKYVSTHWSLLLLAELDVGPADQRFRMGTEFMISATRHELEKHLDSKITDWSCFWGNLLRYAFPASSGDDPQLEQLVLQVCRDLQRGPCCCRANDGRPCAWGVLRALWGLAVIPEDGRTDEVESALGEGVAFLLDTFHLEQADYPTRKRGRVSPLWLRLNFPLFYQADLLFALRVFGELGIIDHPGAGPALDWLEQRREKDGRWRGTSPFRGRTYAALGGREETDRWVSLHAARVLQQAGRMAFTRSSD
jgi:hypothetical protein